jgi:hypothetical protein
MHHYIRWLLSYYQPLLNAKHLARWDMMRTLTFDKQSSAFTIGFKQLNSSRGWFLLNLMKLFGFQVGNGLTGNGTSPTQRIKALDGIWRTG